MMLSEFWLNSSRGGIIRFRKSGNKHQGHTLAATEYYLLIGSIVFCSKEVSCNCSLTSVKATCIPILWNQPSKGGWLCWPSPLFLVVGTDLISNSKLLCSLYRVSYGGVHDFSIGLLVEGLRIFIKRRSVAYALAPWQDPNHSCIRGCLLLAVQQYRC